MAATQRMCGPPRRDPVGGVEAGGPKASPRHGVEEARHARVRRDAECKGGRRRRVLAAEYDAPSIAKIYSREARRHLCSRADFFDGASSIWRRCGARRAHYGKDFIVASTSCSRRCQRRGDIC